MIKMSLFYLYKFNGNNHKIYYKSPIPIQSPTSVLIYQGDESYVNHALGYIHDVIVNQHIYVQTGTEPFVVINDFPSINIIDSAVIIHMVHYRD